MIKNLFIFITFVLLSLALFIFTSGCTKKIYVPVEHEALKKDSVFVASARSDSVVARDSVIIYQKGDSLTVYKTRDRVVNRVIHDTVFSLRVDSVFKEVPVTSPDTSAIRPTPSRKRVSSLFWSLLLIGLMIFGVRIFPRLRK